MTFENIVGKISSILAAVVIYSIAGGFYLSQKGFVWEDGDFILVRGAYAAERPSPSVNDLVRPAPFSVTPHHYLGASDAPVTLYEFSSLGCTHCADFHLDLLPKLKKDYVDTGKLRIVFVDFPIDQRSMKASMLARCVSKDKYFDFLGLLFKKQNSWGYSPKAERILSGYAEMEGLSAEEAKKCMADDKVAEEIIYNRQQALEKLKIQGTPSFLIRGSGEEEVIHGVPSYSRLQEIIGRHL